MKVFIKDIVLPNVALKVAATVALLCVSGCSSTEVVDTEIRPPTAIKPYASEGVYNRLRLAHLPKPLPSTKATKAKAQLRRAPIILPAVHLEMHEATLEETLEALSTTTSYHTYCSSKVAEKKISINTLGTIDELAEKISIAGGINVIVDHDTRSVSFFPNTDESAEVEEPMA